MLDNTTIEVDIFEHPNAMLWLKQYCKENPFSFTYFNSLSHKDLIKLFGQSNKENQGYAIWEVEYFGITFVIKNNKNDTSFTVYYLGNEDSFKKDMKFGNYITSFLQKLCEDIIKTI